MEVAMRRVGLVALSGFYLLFSPLSGHNAAFAAPCAALFQAQSTILGWRGSVPDFLTMMWHRGERPDALLRAYKNDAQNMPKTVDLTEARDLFEPSPIFAGVPLPFPGLQTPILNYHERVLSLRKGDTVVFGGNRHRLGEFLYADDGGHVFRLPEFPGYLIYIPFLSRPPFPLLEKVKGVGGDVRFTWEKLEEFIRLHEVGTSEESAHLQATFRYALTEPRKNYLLFQDFSHLESGIAFLKRVSTFSLVDGILEVRLKSEYENDSRVVDQLDALVVTVRALDGVSLQLGRDYPRHIPARYAFSVGSNQTTTGIWERRIAWDSGAREWLLKPGYYHRLSFDIPAAESQQSPPNGVQQANARD